MYDLYLKKKRGSKRFMLRNVLDSEVSAIEQTLIADGWRVAKEEINREISFSDRESWDFSARDKVPKTH